MSQNPNRQAKKVMTLCIVRKDGKILLGKKKIGLGTGHWNGFGGKVEANESIEDAARRELYEESGLSAGKMEKKGIIDFAFEEDEKRPEVHIFEVTEYEGTESETEEMKPCWFTETEVPYNEMWPADAYWLPFLLSGKKFKGNVLFDRPSSADHVGRIIRKDVKEVSEL